MAYETTEFWFCDWYAARDQDKAVAAVDNGIDGDPRVPLEWVRIQVDRLVPNPDFARDLEERKSAAKTAMLHERGADDAPTDDDVAAYTAAMLVLSPVEIPPFEAETGIYCLSPEKSGWLSVLGIPGYGGDPARIFTVAAASLPSPVLPSAEDLAAVLMSAVDPVALTSALNDVLAAQEAAAAEVSPDASVEDETKRMQGAAQLAEQGAAVVEAQITAGIRQVLDVIRASRTPVTATDLENAINHAVRTTELPEDAR